MKNPHARRVYLDLQATHLADKGEQILDQYFLHNPFGRGAIRSSEQKAQQQLRQFSLFAALNFPRVRYGMSQQYDAIFRLVEETATDHGVSPEAIENMELYTSQQGMNALTVSLSEKRLIVVFGADILERLTLSELRGIVGHEIGHVLSRHIVERTALHRSLKDLGSLFGVRSEDWDIHAELVMRTSEDHDTDLASRFPAFGATEGVTEERELSEEEKETKKRKQFARNFLVMAVEFLRSQDAPAATLGFFEMLLGNVRNLGTLKVDPMDFIDHSQSFLSLSSRAHERTADNFGATVVKNEALASGFAKLFGVNLFTHKEKALVFESLRKQYEELLQVFTTEEIAQKEDGRSHPSPIPRVVRILDLPKYPSILFGSPFLRVAALTEAITIRAKQEEDYFELLLEELMDCEIPVELSTDDPDEAIYEDLGCEH